jgi:hypothetical protein
MRFPERGKGKWRKRGAGQIRLKDAKSKSAAKTSPGNNQWASGRSSQSEQWVDTPTPPPAHGTSLLAVSVCHQSAAGSSHTISSCEPRPGPSRAARSPPSSRTPRPRPGYGGEPRTPSPAASGCSIAQCCSLHSTHHHKSAQQHAPVSSTSHHTRQTLNGTPLKMEMECQRRALE